MAKQNDDDPIFTLMALSVLPILLYERLTILLKDISGHSNVKYRLKPCIRTISTVMKGSTNNLTELTK